MMGVADFNHNRADDVVHNSSTRQTAIWYLKKFI